MYLNLAPRILIVFYKKTVCAEKDDNLEKIKI